MINRLTMIDMLGQVAEQLEREARACGVDYQYDMIELVTAVGRIRAVQEVIERVIP